MALLSHGCLGATGICVSIILSYMLVTSWDEEPQLLLSGDLERMLRYGPPVLWDRVPRGLEDFPVSENSSLIDPWNYLHRQGMYRLLLTATAGAMQEFGASNTGNLLWGLALQHGWQMSSGRLKNFDGSSPWNCGEDILREATVKGESEQQPHDLCISASSWWASLNYYLAVIPFLGAVQAGLFDYWDLRIEILKPAYIRVQETEHGHPPSDNPPHWVDQYCTSIPECSQHAPNSLEAWTKFFLTVKNYEEPHQNTRQDVGAVPLTRLDVFKAYLWHAHVQSIEGRLKRFEDRLVFLSLPEQRFGVGWASLVGFLADTQVVINYNSTVISQRGLPPRVLRPADQPPNIPDFSSSQNKVVNTVYRLHAANNYTDGVISRLWKRAMCSRAGRRVGQSLLRSMTGGPIHTIKVFVKLLFYSLTTPCDSISL